MKMFQEVPAVDAFWSRHWGTSRERFETVGMEAAVDEGMPKVTYHRLWGRVATCLSERPAPVTSSEMPVK